MIVYRGLDRWLGGRLPSRRRPADNPGTLMPLPSRQFLAILALSGIWACASSGAVPAPFPAPGRSSAPAVSPSSPAAPSAAAVVATALSLKGTPYRNGGSTPSGFDCSGFIWYVFGVHGIAVPRTVADQFRSGRGVRPDELRAGDLVFFDTAGSSASHVGVVVGSDAFVHAPSSRGQVRVEQLSARYWSSRYVGARRITR
jgi:cell wall-associated NlpC family hydrolase